MNYKSLYRLYILNLFLIALIIANPFIIYLLFQNILVVIGTFLLVTLSIFLSWKYQGHRKWILIYIINFFALVSIFFHFEVVFRYAFPDYIIEDLYAIGQGYYFNKPYLNQNFEDKEYNALYRTNSQGFRINEIISYEKTVGHCDWLFLGDSYTQGAQVNFEDLFTSLLYKNFPDKIIINAGVSGFGLPEMYNYYREEGKKLNPKVVFVQICNFNDFMNVEDKQILPVDYLMHYSDLARFLLYNLRYQQPGELPLGRWTEPFYSTAKQNADYNIFYKETSDKKNNDLSNFREYLILLNNEVKENGAKLVLFQIPTKEQIYFKYFNEVITGFKIDVTKLDISFPNRFLKNLTDSLSIKYIDLQEGYSQSIHQVFFDYDEHLNTEGHKVTSQILSGFIKKNFGNPSFKLESSGFYGERYPSCSINSQYIYFQSFRHNNYEIFRTPDNFNSYERLTVNDVDEIHPCVSPDNKRLVFTEGEQKYNNTDVILLNMTTGERKNITAGKNEYGAIPTFNSDGTKLTYAKWFYDEQFRTYSNPEIVIKDLFNEKTEIVVDDQYENWRPVFSPDNNSIVFISKRNGNFDLFIYNLHSNKIYQLTNTSYDEWDPRFSPKGDKIVYAAKPGDTWDLYEYNLTNGTSIQLTKTNGDDWDPFYMTNNKIIFAGEYGFISGIFSININEIIKGN